MMDNFGILKREQNHQKKTKVLLDVIGKSYKTSAHQYILVLVEENLTIIRNLYTKFKQLRKFLN